MKKDCIITEIEARRKIRMLGHSRKQYDVIYG